MQRQEEPKLQTIEENNDIAELRKVLAEEVRSLYYKRKEEIRLREEIMKRMVIEEPVVDVPVADELVMNEQVKDEPVMKKTESKIV